MKITSAEFIKSAFNETHYTDDGLPEISFLGRSNVGKSSLINSLLQRKGLARTSNTPGRTQCINFFEINESFYFVDLPGYGYAKVSKAMRKDWGKMAENYLANREELVLSIQLVDSRHAPTELDIQLNEWLKFHHKNFIVVATKADKLSSNQLNKTIKEIEKKLPDSKIISYSAVTGKGKDALWAEIGASLQSF
ncbi:MAG: ribosome biogenesis GTP-binding protein YihA/YsxC [Pyrinomonadaceae bacterium]|nr:ribosome biogenesis GTP-binding protein YihA/YsxC [Pyrinomonadaceae bacterium]